ncbi:KUP/HAK/KT family potassium transporter [Prosthecobacter sp.]|uniref:potassium transporter Kup n=1 Tax=Prosthecobacter sp. TaxID=1965333 RepID=UPI001D8B002E|nr:KUP/HAK/KT family potassium transporter [Prosthecobacter sp.]MCB1277371.1 KUP/HAK/KT family potassium transporter [Prosthecobacter sp.]
MSEHKNSNSWTLALVALGVVFGDIGTSPLYALKECLHHANFDPANPDRALLYGPVSLMFWSLCIMVGVKYLAIVSHATNQGEGGMFAILSLLRGKKNAFSPRMVRGFVIIALLGASLLYGDGMITPAISVLSAVEGLEVLSQNLHEFIVPLAVGILIGLFFLQRHGTAKIGASFGPVMIVWFSTLGALGLYRLASHPEVLLALSPHWGWAFLAHHGMHGIVIMGSVLLAVTGCEALYADIGHFGRKPLMRAWFILAFPCLTLNYLGQTALITGDPSAAGNPFFRLVPAPVLVPVIVLATIATIIASQAMITGVFSITQQAVQMGYLPRLKIIHTNPDVRGQIYMPQVNFLLMIACVTLVLTFRSSSNLASAYGLSVSMEMFLVSGMFFCIATRIWNWPLWKAGLPVVSFMIIEAGYLAGSLTKFFDGAWFPLAVAAGMLLVMKTWTDGRAVLYQAMLRGRLPVQHLVDEIKKDRIIRVPGTAVFMSASADGLPLALLHHLKHNKALHQQVVLMSVKFEDVPYVSDEERNEISEYHDEFYRVILRYGFSESPDVFNDLCAALSSKTKIKRNAITFYQSREVLLTNGPGKMADWRKKLFVMLSRLSRPATGYFDLPPRQVIELGIQLEV